MFDQQDGHVEFVADEADGLHEFGGFVRVHAGGGFVEEEELGACREGAGDFEFSLFAVGEVGREGVAVVV